MCRQVKCKKCGKATWAGCGQHKSQVLAGVPKDQRCRCSKELAPYKTAPAAKPAEKSGFFGKLFGR